LLVSVSADVTAVQFRSHVIRLMKTALGTIDVSIYGPVLERWYVSHQSEAVTLENARNAVDRALRKGKPSV